MSTARKRRSHKDFGSPLTQEIFAVWNVAPPKRGTVDLWVPLRYLHLSSPSRTSIHFKEMSTFHTLNMNASRTLTGSCHPFVRFNPKAPGGCVFVPEIAVLDAFEWPLKASAPDFSTTSSPCAGGDRSLWKSGPKQSYSQWNLARVLLRETSEQPLVTCSSRYFTSRRNPTGVFRPASTVEYVQMTSCLDVWDWSKNFHCERASYWMF